MDYRYIEQLVERYFDCKTTLAEEEILRAFFSQDEVPAELIQYQPLFLMEEQSSKEELLDSGFDQKIMMLTGTAKQDIPVVKAKVLPLSSKLRPLFRAAAIVAIVFMVGNAAQMPYEEQEQNTAAMEVDSVDTTAPSVAQGDTLIQNSAVTTIQ